MTNRPARRQLRRRARQLRRDGFQPTMFLSPDEPMPETAGAIVVRALWRYRSELAPIAAAAGVAIAAVTLHRAHPTWWPWLMAVTLADVAALALPAPRRLRKEWPLLGRTAERAYAAAVSAAAGGWLTAATALGPAAPPMPALAVILAGACAVPWWASRRRRAKVRLERTLESWPEIARAVGLAGSQVMSAMVDLWGWRARFRLARGQTMHDVIAKIPAIESGLGTFRGAVRVYPTPDNYANRCELRVLDADPHADAIPWPGPSVTSITEPIELGPFEDAEPCRVSFLRRHVLFGGATGAGKSGGLNVLIGNLSACRDVVLWGIDLKKGMELGPWLSCLDRLATTPDAAQVLLADAVAVLEARAAVLAEQGQRVWVPAPDMPVLIVLIDEYAELVDDAPGAVRHADSVARRGRAVAVSLVAATQRPTQKAMGHGAVRSQMDVRICFRVRERKDVDLILGQGMLAAGWQAHTLDAPGKFFVSAPEHSTPRRGRAYLITDEVVTSTASAHADLRPDLDEVSRHAIEEQDRIEPDAGTSGEADDPQGSPPDSGGRTSSMDDAPEVILWAALSLAPDEGTTVADLMTATGMSRPWVYQRLRALAGRGQVVQVSRGRWRAAGGDAE
jgi:S-DNA-T family DNA segregation ATPase FtsK/SpoIIIE